MVRILIGLLFGFILGVGGTIQYISSGHGNLQLMTSPQVHQLEEQVKQGNQQIDQLTKKLEAAADAMEKTTARFTALEHRFEALGPAAGVEALSPPAAESDTSAAKPSPEAPSGGSPQQPAESPSPS